MKVLVADDDAVMRMLLERQLRTWGHDVRTVGDGAEALQAIESDPALEVLLVDWVMPVLDGLEVCRLTRLLERSHYIFIVLMTSRSGRENYLTGMSAGADDFMTKPLDVDELQVRMHSAERVIHLQTEAQVQKMVAEELRDLDQMKKSFIALTSHELRSPIALILLHLELLSSQKSLMGKDTFAVVEKVMAVAQRLRRIIEEILKASHEGRYVKELNLENYDLGALVRETVDSVTSFAALRSQTIQVEIEPCIPEMMFDAGKIGDALANLLMNAIKFTPDNRAIAVRVNSNGPDTVRVSVSDPGVGISDGDKSHIFDRLFATLDYTHHSSGYYEFNKRGIGLGLAITKDFVEMHGGAVGFESEAGKGSCFHFDLPIRRL